MNKEVMYMEHFTLNGLSSYQKSSKYYNNFKDTKHLHLPLHFHASKSNLYLTFLKKHIEIPYRKMLYQGSIGYKSRGPILVLFGCCIGPQRSHCSSEGLNPDIPPGDVQIIVLLSIDTTICLYMIKTKIWIYDLTYKHGCIFYICQFIFLRI